eukprot:NODE_2225_length_1171_cov_34.185383_g1845_i0.p1 GENE.NODE_2225_length_1171_cov_34.185383_g1845_i0~~NODE_2225_length_1171_cov_34.185383_g1845_i0.p1  ORF type:complete len:291 (+),score=55.80 NODE_2225_length_1171_cov_34.185383_g1845_i0:161-1033(+)
MAAAVKPAHVEGSNKIMHPELSDLCRNALGTDSKKALAILQSMSSELSAGEVEVIQKLQKAIQDAQKVQETVKESIENKKVHSGASRDKVVKQTEYVYKKSLQLAESVGETLPTVPRGFADRLLKEPFNSKRSLEWEVPARTLDDHYLSIADGSSRSRQRTTRESRKLHLTQKVTAEKQAFERDEAAGRLLRVAEWDRHIRFASTHFFDLVDKSDPNQNLDQTFDQTHLETQMTVTKMGFQSSRRMSLLAAEQTPADIVTAQPPDGSSRQYQLEELGSDADALDASWLRV